MFEAIREAFHTLFGLFATSARAAAAQPRLTEKLLDVAISIAVGLVPFATFKLGLRSNLRARRADRFKTHVTDVSIGRLLTVFDAAENILLSMLKAKIIHQQQTPRSTLSASLSANMAKVFQEIAGLRDFISSRLYAFDNAAAIPELVRVCDELRRDVEEVFRQRIPNVDRSQDDLALMLRGTERRIVDLICSNEEKSLAA